MYPSRIIVTLISLWIEVVFCLKRTSQCNNVVVEYSKLGYSSSDAPISAQTGKDLQVCRSNISCCSRLMEFNILANSQRDLANLTAIKTENLRTFFMVSTTNFNNFVYELIEDRRMELHEMFARAYGHLYKSNEEVFKLLFDNFIRYYQRGDLNVDEVMNQFFAEVFKRMFIMQNPEYQFDREYLNCVVSKMESVEPFGNTPSILKRSVKQALMAARTFVQGLAVGRNVALKLAQVEATPACTSAYARMTSCSLCQGHINLQPCWNYCINVMQGCLASQAELNSSWSNYIDAMLELSNRLESGGSFNIESIISPLKSMISNAIMEYHGNNKVVTDKLFDAKGCGPYMVSTRPKRSATEVKPKSSKSQVLKPPAKKDFKNIMTSLVKEIKTKLRQLRSLWVDLPNSMCEGKPNSTSRECWNGSEKVLFSPPISKPGLDGNRSNSEMIIQSSSNALIKEQIEELKKAASHLNNAKYGINVDWLDLDVNLLPVSKALNSSYYNPKVQNGGPPADGVTKSTVQVTEEVGSGREPVVDTDDEDDTDEGSGAWNSDIIKIAPPEPKKPKPNLGDKSREKPSTPLPIRATTANPYEDKFAGSGQDPSDSKPYLIPVKPTYEGSGGTHWSFPDNEDDEDIVRPATKEPKIINTERNSNLNSYRKQETTPKSNASSLSPCFYIYITVSILLINVCHR